MSLTNEGIRARAAEPITLDDVAVDAVTVGMSRRRHARRPEQLAGARPRGGPRPGRARAHNDLSLPAINLLGAIGLPLIMLALILEAMHSLRRAASGARPGTCRRRSRRLRENRNTMNATRTLTARMASLVAAAGLLLTGCGASARALVRREVAPAVASDVAKPCTRRTADRRPPHPRAPAGLAATFDRGANKIVPAGGRNVTLARLSKA